MHLMRTFCYTKCYKCIFAYIFLWKMFSVHFPKENVRKNAFDAKMHLMLPLHFVYKMLESGKMHLMQKCIFATRTFSKGKCSAYILLWKMFSITFSKRKCSAKQNVTNAFDAKMHFGCAKMLCFLLCKKQNVTNAFDAVQKCI